MRKNLLFAAGLTGLLLLAACNSATDNNAPQDTGSSQDTASSQDISSSVPMSMSGSAADSTQPDVSSSVSSQADMQSSQTTDNTQSRVVNVAVSSWAFTPNMIAAHQGEKIVVHLTGVSGMHSFGIPELGLNVPINAGETKDVVIPTDKPGNYTFRCLVPCGEGHHDMTGQIVIS